MSSDGIKKKMMMMEEQILKDVERVSKEKNIRPDLALAILACRYTDIHWRKKAEEMLDESILLRRQIQERENKARWELTERYVVEEVG